MLEQSFIFLDRVGRSTEERFWRSGIASWSDFLRKKSVPGISTMRKGYCDRQIEKAEKNLLAGNAPYFANILESADQWRTFDAFKEGMVYLDIETSGYYGDVTVVGLYDGVDTKIMVKGINLDGKTLKEELARYKGIVTFNGASFDLPVLERYYPGVTPFIPHIDLRHVCAKIGLSGGLKAIERRLGISRGDGLDGLSGEDAVHLWNAWRATGDRDHLDKLVAYNEEDIVNLLPLAEFACRKLKDELLAESKVN